MNVDILREVCICGFFLEILMTYLEELVAIICHEFVRSRLVLVVQSIKVKLIHLKNKVTILLRRVTPI